MKQEVDIYQLKVEAKDDGLRLDQFLGQSSFIKNRSQALKIIAEKGCTLKDNQPLKASYRLKQGDFVIMKIPKENPEESKLYNIPLDFLYEDQDILIVNKPAGLVVHPGSGHKTDTLINALFYYGKISPREDTVRPGVVHRLDKETSGLLILAKTELAEKHLVEQFKKRQVKRIYWALAYPTPSLLSGTIESYLCRHPILRKKFISVPRPQGGAKRACTHYKVLKQHSSGICLLECQLETGRTHQIRVHMNSIGSPLLGEKVYTGKQKRDIQSYSKGLDRIALHAHYLEFTHPVSGKTLIFNCPWPLDLKNILTKLDFIE